MRRTPRQTMRGQMHSTEIKLTNGDTLVVEDQSDHRAIAKALAEHGFYSTTRLNAGYSSLTRTPITVLERAVVYLQAKD